MWPYTNDESNWLDLVEVMKATPRPTVAELELAARRYRSRVIAGWLRSGFFALRTLVRRGLPRLAAKHGSFADGHD
ncbi:MAG: hypothetical protein FJX54_11270 [Alphaproteobacteria bacterium]|nr:hypothetical protein [Alphaproteobacteria bacterium]